MSSCYIKLKNFLENKMRMSHIYQPVFIKELIKSNGKVTIEDISKVFLSYDKSQLEYYEYITKTMPSKILKKHGIIEQNKKEYILNEEYSNLSNDEIEELIKICDIKINDYLEKRLDTYDHRKRNYSNLSGSIRYRIIKRAGGRCEACGVSSEERAIDVDHIIPKNKGGSDEEFNLQALCYKCNRQKRDTDNTNFIEVKDSYNNRNKNCIFCDLNKHNIKVIDENELAIAFYDSYPVTKYHVLIIPKRHVLDYFELHQPEQNAIQQLLKSQKNKLLKLDNTITGFNVGINIGEDSGQTIFHVHVHLIPRRKGDISNPKGGVRGVIPEKQKY